MGTPIRRGWRSWACPALFIFFLLAFVHTVLVDAAILFQETRPRPTNETITEYGQYLCRGSTNHTTNMGRVARGETPSVCCDNLTPVVYAVAKNGSILNAGRPVENYTQFAGAYRMVVAPAAYDISSENFEKDRLVMWNPFHLEEAADFRKVLVNALQHLVCQRTIDIPNQKPLVAELWNVGWGPIQALYNQDRQPGAVAQSDHPDVIFVRHSHVHAFQSKGFLADINRYLRAEYSKPAAEKDPFVSALYLKRVKEDMVDYFRLDSDTWAAVPVIMHVPFLAWNLTTYTASEFVGSKPTGTGTGCCGSLVEYWNMKENPFTWADLADMTRKIQSDPNVGVPYPFDFEPGYDEELALISSNPDRLTPFGRALSLEAQDYTDYTCALTTPDMIRSLNTTIGQLVGNDTFDPDMFPASDPNYQKWNADWEKGITDLKNPSPFTEYYRSKPLIGYRFTTPDRPAPRLPNIHLGLHPSGDKLALSGFGLAATYNTRNISLAYSLVALLASFKAPYLVGMNVALDSVAPYTQAQNMYPWETSSKAKREILVYYHTTTVGAPIGYPFGFPPQISEISERKPFRNFLMDLVVKKQPMEIAADRACKILNHIFLPECRMDRDLQMTMGVCDKATNQLTVKFHWRMYNETHQACRDDENLLPAPQTVTCRYPGTQSAIVQGMFALSGLGIAYCLIAMVAIWLLRAEKAIKSASPFYCIVMLLGCVFMFAAVFLLPGLPSRVTITIALWLFIIGWCLLYSSVAVKLYRIFECFRTKRVKTGGMRLTDTFLMLPLSLLVLVDVILLLTWTFLEPINVGIHTHDLPIMHPKYGSTNFEIPLTQVSTNFGPAFYVLVTYNILLVVVDCIFSAKLWNVPSDYNESKFILGIVYNLAMVSIIAVPLIITFDDMIVKYLLFSSCLFFMLVFAITIFFVPKILTIMSCINLHGLSSASTHRRTTSQSQSGTETEKGGWGRFFSRAGGKTSLPQRSSKNRSQALRTNSMTQDLAGADNVHPAPPAHVRLQQLNSGVMEGSAHMSAADLGQAERDEEAAMNDKDMRKKVREMKEMVKEISAENAMLKEKLVAVNNAHSRAEGDKRPAAANRSSQWLLG